MVPRRGLLVAAIAAAYSTCSVAQDSIPGSLPSSPGLSSSSVTVIVTVTAPVDSTNGNGLSTSRSTSTPAETTENSNLATQVGHRCSVTLIDLPPTLADFDPGGNWDPVGMGYSIRGYDPVPAGSVIRIVVSERDIGLDVAAAAAPLSSNSFGFVRLFLEMVQPSMIHELVASGFEEYAVDATLVLPVGAHASSSSFGSPNASTGASVGIVELPCSTTSARNTDAWRVATAMASPSPASGGANDAPAMTARLGGGGRSSVHDNGVDNSTSTATDESEGIVSRQVVLVLIVAVTVLAVVASLSSMGYFCARIGRLDGQPVALENRQFTSKMHHLKEPPTVSCTQPTTASPTSCGGINVDGIYIASSPDPDQSICEYLMAAAKECGDIDDAIPSWVWENQRGSPPVGGGSGGGSGVPHEIPSTVVRSFTNLAARASHSPGSGAALSWTSSISAKRCFDVDTLSQPRSPHVTEEQVAVVLANGLGNNAYSTIDMMIDVTDHRSPAEPGNADADDRGSDAAPAELNISTGDSDDGNGYLDLQDPAIAAVLEDNK